MTTPLRFSVVVVSHGRPMLLKRALIGISQLFYRPFETVVVADAEGLAAIRDLPFINRLKTAEQSLPNISAARNIGVQMAGGDIVAFMDDDAVPEPTWLNHFASAFADRETDGVTGTVLGRNGISVQWANRIVGVDGEAVPYEGGNLSESMAIKLEGTNMAIRRDALVRLGGFDETLRFFLDETDLAIRMAAAGMKVIFVPSATVHHGYAASVRRSAARIPLSLYEIGRSTAIFQKKHNGASKVALKAARDHQTHRISELLKAGSVTDSGANDLIDSFDQGIVDGGAAQQESAIDLTARSEFVTFAEQSPPEPQILTGRWFSKMRMLQDANALAVKGHSISLFVFEPTIRAHRVSFVESGVWLQYGGLFGPSDRRESRFSWWAFSRRVVKETQRLRKIRWISNP